MRRVVVSVIVGLWALTAFGQLAPDIARGTSAEEVIRTHGWPKGKSVTNGRESWLYDRFQVLFQNGTVVSVTYIAPTTPEPVTLTPPRNVSVPDPGTLKPAPNARPQPSPPFPSPRARTKASPAASDYLVPPNASQPTAPRSPAASFSTPLLAGAAIVGALGVSAGLLVLMINRRANEKSLSEQMLDPPPAEPGAQRKTWEQEVAEKLRRANGSPPKTETTADSIEASSATDFPSAAPPLVVNELTLELLRQLEWKRFELIVQRYYGATGLRAECTCIGPDGGVDVKLSRPGEERPYCYIQCKAWGSEKVKLTTLREFLGVMAADKISEGIFITTSDFRPEARAFAEANGIAALTAADFINRFNELKLDSRRTILADVTAGDYTTPTCPSCDCKMVWREVEKPFWGCPKYPRCRSSPIYPRGAA